MTTRESVVSYAKSWLGTPYHHHARIKGVGVDCAQILAAVYEEAGIIPHTELGDYPCEWHYHHDEERYIDWLIKGGARRLDSGNEPQAGDIGVWRFGRTFSHGGIVIEGGKRPLILHAYIQRGVVLSYVDEEPISGRTSQFWSIVNGR
jgi:cell wall-associated NlpC family hydrolase